MRSSLMLAALAVAAAFPAAEAAAQISGRDRAFLFYNNYYQRRANERALAQNQLRLQSALRSQQRAAADAYQYVPPTGSFRDQFGARPTSGLRQQPSLPPIYRGQGASRQYFQTSSPYFGNSARYLGGAVDRRVPRPAYVPGRPVR